MKRFWTLAFILILTGTSVSFANTVNEYYPDGTLKDVARYNSKHQLNGRYTMYWPDGHLKQQGRYKNGQLVGPIKKYSQDGELLGS